MVNVSNNRWAKSCYEWQSISADVSTQRNLLLFISLIVDLSCSVSFGQTPAGNTFAQSYPQFEEQYAQPYLAWLKKVYRRFSNYTICLAY